MQYWAILLFFLAGCGGATTPRYMASLEDEARDRRPAVEIEVEPDRLRPGDIAARPWDIRIYPNSRFCALGFIDPEVQRVMDALNPPAIGNRWSTIGLAAGPTTEIEMKYGLPYGTVTTPGSSRTIGAESTDERGVIDVIERCPHNGINVIMTQHATLNATGRPYRITLTARQGSKFWTRSVDRPEYVAPVEIVPGRVVQPTDRPWTPNDDAKSLNLQFFTSLLEGREA